jgi:hypothetical protein
MNMRHILRAALTLAIAAIVIVPSVSSEAAPPMPSFRYYGMLYNEYGWPVTLDDNVVLVLKDGTNECARCTVNENLGEGINYILEVPIDYPRISRYATYAARTGDVVTITTYRSTLVQPLMNTSSLPRVGSAGDAARVNLNMGADSDGDGLSDEWETLLVIGYFPELYSSIWDVHPGDDPDGDHAPNVDEFRSGTMPYAAEDVFQVYQWMKASDGSFVVKFYAVKGNTYDLFTSSAALTDINTAWDRVPFRMSLGGGDVSSYTVPTTGWNYFYVAPQTNLNLIRLEIVR